MSKEIFTRKQLYEMVWETPISTLSKKYNISEAELRKICSEINIPLPQTGYWSKKQFGKEVQQILLPIIDEPEQSIELEFRTQENINKASLSSLEKIKVNNFDDSLKVPETLTNPDKIIISTQKYYLASAKRLWNSPEMSLPHLNLKVSEQLLQRALLFMDTFIKALKKRGYDVRIENHQTNVLINNQEIQIALREKTKFVQTDSKSWGRTNEHTGKLVFKIDTWNCKEWADGNNKIEEKLPEIIARLESRAEEQRLQAIEREKRHQEAEQKKAIKLKFEAQRKQDLLSFKDALDNATRWHQTNNLRDFINEIELRAKQNGSYTEELKVYLQRLNEQADWYDPFINANDELLKEINKKTLEVPKSEYYW